MTEGENGSNRRKALAIRTGRLVEAHMALICGKVSRGLSAADFDHH
jgi:hypothetical protein